MAVRIAIEANVLAPETIAAVLAALVSHNVELYERREVIRSPFNLRWVPDGFADAAVLRDAIVLDRRGYGSCGELAAAYAAWLAVHHGGRGELELLSDGPDSWHVVALLGGEVYDPAEHGKGVSRGA